MVDRGDGGKLADQMGGDWSATVLAERLLRLAYQPEHKRRWLLYRIVLLLDAVLGFLERAA